LEAQKQLSPGAHDASEEAQDHPRLRDQVQDCKIANHRVDGWQASQEASKVVKCPGDELDLSSGNLRLAPRRCDEEHSGSDVVSDDRMPSLSKMQGIDAGSAPKIE
jgi:hypothetical protein